jgi:hypothetical protein
VLILRWSGTSRSLADREHRLSQAARRHRIGKAHAFHVVATAAVMEETDPKSGDLALIWVGPDTRGVELTIVAVEKKAYVVVTPVQPTYRRRK